MHRCSDRFAHRVVQTPGVIAGVARRNPLVVIALQALAGLVDHMAVFVVTESVDPGFAGGHAKGFFSPLGIAIKPLATDPPFRLGEQVVALVLDRLGPVLVVEPGLEKHLQLEPMGHPHGTELDMQLARCADLDRSGVTARPENVNAGRINRLLRAIAIGSQFQSEG